MDVRRLAHKSAARCKVKAAKKTRPAAPAPSTSGKIDLAADLNKKPVMVGRARKIHLCLVGCGGTGGWLAPDLVRFALSLRLLGVETHITLVDPDVVEISNVNRQNFCPAECGRNKAETLAMRLSAGWGVELHVQPVPYKREMALSPQADLTVVIGCVDNAAARRAIAETLDGYTGWDSEAKRGPMRLWWLDVGNARDSGQVLLGSTRKPERLLDPYPLPDRCGALPAPSLQHPELLETRPEELSPELSGLSCEEMAARNAQSLVINRMMAAVASDYLVKLLFNPPRRDALSFYASYVDMHTMTVRSKPILPEALEVFAHPKRKRQSRRTHQTVPTPAPAAQVAVPNAQGGQHENW